MVLEKSPPFVKVFFEKQAKITKILLEFHACRLKLRMFSKECGCFWRWIENNFSIKLFLRG